jgi:hypothetical protein
VHGATGVPLQAAVIITTTFVMLNNPKTGSSFARTVLKEIHTRRTKAAWWKRLSARAAGRQALMRELLLPDMEYDGRLSDRSRSYHGSYAQIPARYRGREVVSITRNPYLLFASHYEFRWWAEHPPIDPEVLARHFPRFPNLSIDEFVDFSNMRVAHGPFGDRLTDLEIGDLTLYFVKMFFRDPAGTLNGLPAAWTGSRQFAELLPPITFLRQENLLEDLTGFLARHGYADDELALVRDHARVNETMGGVEDRTALLTPKVIAHIQTRERLLLQMLESRGIHYDVPAASNERR